MKSLIFNDEIDNDNNKIDTDKIKKCNNTNDDDDDDGSKSEEMHLTCVGDFLTFCEFKLCFKVQNLLLF